MTHLIRGEILRDRAFDVPSLRRFLQEDIVRPPLEWRIIEEALARLLAEYSVESVSLMLRDAGMGGYADALARAVVAAMRPENLRGRLRDELGEEPFAPRETSPGFFMRYAPVGVLAHVAAGNMPGIAALSALEGLMTGNINLIKPPGNDGGFTANLLARLARIEPRLAPYLYVIDVPSSDAPLLRELLSLADGVSVWGSDEAIAGVRALTGPGTRLIEWGHRYSFAYVTPDAATDEALEGIARDICETDQLLCSAPQCVLFGTDDREALRVLTKRLADIMDRISPQCPPARRDLSTQAQITILTQTARAMEAAGKQTLYEGKNGGWALILDHEGKGLRASPLYRTVWVTGCPQERLSALLSPHRGHLQTVGLAASGGERQRLTETFIACGASRITSPGQMSRGEIGDPRDGQSPLGRYVRRVTYTS